ncbi:MAG TPA: cobalamin-independent methionine synthase II family protein [Gaiellaceae bacterium]|nr:cobalamin-independent methionine synthase II family protein [Gaiellaceae bacterium]
MDRILTTHTGSLIRPQAVLDFLVATERGESYDEAAYERALDDAVADVVRRQAEAGIDVVDDGEMGKPSWITYLYERVSGIEPRLVPLEGAVMLPPSRDRQAFPEFYAELDARYARTMANMLRVAEKDREAASAADMEAEGKYWYCTGPIEYDGSALQRDIARLKEALAGVDVADVFLPVVAPASVYWLRNEYYASEEEFVYAVADALHEEYKAIVDAGFLVQVDDAVLLHEYDSILSLGGSVDDYRRWAELRVDALVHALSGIPQDRIRYHVCHGSWHGPHAYDPPLADVIDLVLRVPARYHLIEQGNVRHEHEWRLWEDVALPDGKVLVPGVVTHHTNVVEHPELVAERLVRLAKLVGRENVMGGTDCGFAQGAFVQRVHPTIQWAKLEALAEGARIATERLW